MAAHPLHLLTFLGARPLEETTYAWRELTYAASAAPLATTSFLKPRRVSVFLTKLARQTTYPAFEKEFRERFPAIILQPVDVPSGRDEQELWTLFEKMVDAVLEAEERDIALDITHGFRSLPLMAMLAAVYARSAFAVQIEAVLYGALDAAHDGQTPMFDLSPMLTLLAWATAADRFNRTGDARYLASLLREQQRALAQRWKQQTARVRSLSALNNLAGSLQEISQALRLIRPHLAMQVVADLPRRVQQAEPVLQQASMAQPFMRLLEHIQRTYAPLALDDPGQQREALVKERTMVLWYAERELWPQAVALAREWLVSWVMAHLGLGPETSTSERRRVEEFLNAEAEAFVTAKQEGRAFQPMFLRGVPEAAAMLSLWKAVTNIRNDILHAGMRDAPEPPATLLKRIHKALVAMQKLPLP